MALARGITTHAATTGPSIDGTNDTNDGRVGLVLVV